VAANVYINATYAASFLGTTVVAALSVDSTISAANVFTQLAVSATASVIPALRNSGYEVPTDTVGDGVLMADETVRLAVMGAFWIFLAGRPEYSVSLPDGWGEHPANVARKQVLTGDANLSLARTTRDAVGGVKFSSSDATTGQPAQITRTTLAGY